MNNIIFGVYSGYNSLKTKNGGIYYFMKSLRKYNKECRVIIICEKNKIFKELTDFSKNMDFEIYSNFDVKYRMMFYRFVIYKKYLDENNIKFNKILLSDINDVIFQGDPFSINFDEEIYCALEQNILSDKNNGSSKLNMQWISTCNHLNNNYNNYLNQYIVCAGTILGSYEGILNFLNFYINAQNKKIVNDQGLYNVYVYNYLISKKILKYNKSKILTLDRISFNTLNIKEFENKKNIYNDDNEKYIIIHQINRCNLKFMLNLVE